MFISIVFSGERYRNWEKMSSSRRVLATDDSASTGMASDLAHAKCSPVKFLALLADGVRVPLF